MGSATSLKSEASTRSQDLLIRGGRVIDPGHCDGVADLYIKDGKIAGLTHGEGKEAPPAGCRVVDAAGMVVTPGLIDLHIDDGRQEGLEDGQGQGDERDEQHEPAAIPRFLEAIQRADLDIVSGSRYLDPEGRVIDLPMGATPLAALNLVCWPNCLPLEMMGQLLAGGARQVPSGLVSHTVSVIGKAGSLTLGVTLMTSPLPTLTVATAKAPGTPINFS